MEKFFTQDIPNSKLTEKMADITPDTGPYGRKHIRTRQLTPTKYFKSMNRTVYLHMYIPQHTKRTNWSAQYNTKELTHNKEKNERQVKSGTSMKPMLNKINQKNKIKNSAHQQQLWSKDSKTYTQVGLSLTKR